MSELYHYGIKGQKWGIRRYQNEDGSLTAEGKKRYYEKGAVLFDTMLSERNKYNKKFDKLTTKMEAKKAAGKKISRLDRMRATYYGKNVRYQDKRAANLDKWLPREERARSAMGKAMIPGLVASGAAIAKGVYDNNKDNYEGAENAAIVAQIANAVAAFSGVTAYEISQNKSGNYKEYKKWSKDIIKEAKDETIEDLKKKGLW